MNKQIRVFQIKEIHHKQRAKSYAQQIEDGFLIHHQNYQSAYKGQVGPSETPVTVRGRLEEQRPNTFIGRPFGVSDVMVWDEEEKRKFFYVDKDELVEFGGFTDIDSAGNVVALMVPNYQVDGKTGTWLPYDSEVVEGVCFFMMRNEQRRDAVSPIVVDSKGVFVTEAPNGFENVRATITEYVRRAERKQQDVTEHEKCLTNGTYERARESGTEQNYNMIDGCVNNNPRKPRVIGNRVSVLDRLHIKLEERKQKASHRTFRVKSCGWLFLCSYLKRWFVIAFRLCTAVLLCMFCFKNHINILTSGLQFVIVVFEIGIAFVPCSSYR